MLTCYRLDSSIQQSFTEVPLNGKYDVFIYEVEHETSDMEMMGARRVKIANKFEIYSMSRE